MVTPKGCDDGDIVGMIQIFINDAREAGLLYKSIMAARRWGMLQRKQRIDDRYVFRSSPVCPDPANWSLVGRHTSMLPGP